MSVLIDKNTALSLIEIFKKEHGIGIEIKTKSGGYIGVITYSREDILNKGKTYTVTLEEYPCSDRGVSESGTWDEAFIQTIFEAHRNIKDAISIK